MLQWFWFLIVQLYRHLWLMLNAQAKVSTLAYIVGYKAKGHKCSYALFEIFCSEDTADHGLP